MDNINDTLIKLRDAGYNVSIKVGFFKEAPWDASAYKHTENGSVKVCKRADTPAKAVASLVEELKL